MPRFKGTPQDPKQFWLIAPSLDDMVSEKNEVRVLSELMENLNWKILESSYYDRGTPAYPPKVMTKILVFAYSKGVRSSRRIEELVESDVRYMWLAGGLKPDFHTIARFRKEKFDLLSQLFADSVRLCKSLGLVNLNIVAVDGTKIAADASRKSLYDSKRVDKELEEVKRILSEAEDVDKSEDAELGDHNGRDVPEHLQDAKSRKAILEDLKKKLDEGDARIISTSDEDCRMMKTTEGIKPAYNVQAAVDSQSQVVLAMKVTQRANDYSQLPDMISEVQKNCDMSGVMYLADTGYSDESTLKYLADTSQEALISLKRQSLVDTSNNLFSSNCFLADCDRDVLICPAGRELSFSYESQCGSGRYRTYSAHGCASCSFREQCVKLGRGSRRVSISCENTLRENMKDKLKSPAGKELYDLRKEIVEPVFGQTKHDRGCKRLLLRGISGAISEMSLVFLVHNLLKCVKQAKYFAFLMKIGIGCIYNRCKYFLSISMNYTEGCFRPFESYY